MNLKELKNILPTSKESWLENQYPGRPKDRYAKQTYLNYDNLKDVFSVDIEKDVEVLLKDHPSEQVVILAKLGLSGSRIGRPFLLTHPESNYYGHYELFACAFHLRGFVEVFHNIQRS